MSSANKAIGESDKEESTSKHCEEDEPWLEAGPPPKNDRRTVPGPKEKIGWKETPIKPVHKFTSRKENSAPGNDLTTFTRGSPDVDLRNKKSQDQENQNFPQNTQ